jgi:alpha-beta hydrolase superfamily lysophospholipase
MKQRKRSTGLAATMLPLLAGGAAFLAADILRRAYTRSRLFAPSPDPVKSWDPADYGIPPEAVEVLEFPTPDGQRLYGWYCRAENPVASALFCHGNTGNLTISADTIPHLLAAGLNVLFFDYRGFGRSTGKPTYDGVISDAVTAARLHDRLRPQHLPSVLYGFSLGGAIAAQLLRRYAFDGLILHSTFTSLGALTRLLFPRVPLHLLGRHLFNTISVVRKLDIPLLVLHGTADEVVPYSMAHELYGACNTERKQIHCVEGALHKTLFQTDPDTLVKLIAQFLTGLPQHASLPSPEPPPLLARYTDTVRRSLRRKTPQEA